MQELSDLWRAKTTDAVNISRDFSPREFVAALNHFKPGKAPGPDTIFPAHLTMLILSSRLRGFLSSCLRHFKIPKSGEER